MGKFMENIEILWRWARITVYYAMIEGFLGERGVVEKLRYTSDCINTRAFSPRDPKAVRATRGRYGLAPEGSVILLVGRLVPKKGFLKLLVASLRPAAPGELTTGRER